MPKPTPRRLTMADQMMLVASIGAALWLWKISQETLTFEVGSAAVFSPAYKVGVWPEPAILASTLALLVARAKKPRPRWRAVFRQPGTWAALAILGHVSWVVLMLSWHALQPSARMSSSYHPDINTYLFANRMAGGWVVAAWSSLALARAWRPERSWVDRSGRVLGVVAVVHWIVSSLVR